MKSFKERKIEKIYNEVINLPNEIISKDYFKMNSVTDDDYREYYEKRNELLLKVDAIILNLRAFIKVNFGSESEYFDEVHNIHFTSERNVGIVFNTFNVAHNEYWQKGKRKLISLVENIKFEIEARKEFEEGFYGSVNQKNLRLAIFMAIYLLLLFVIWKDDYLFTNFFESNKIFATKIIVCLSLLPLLLIIIIPKKWELLIGIFVAIFIVCLPFLK